jgi:indolepyruvate ferredoxin oxidoreductase
MVKVSVNLDDKYTLNIGRILLNGVQALVRIPMMQHQIDSRNGLNTATFISGYRGSPLGNYDSALWQAKQHLKGNNITFQPGVNEDLAATAIWGTQQLNLFPESNVDGVVGIWYGKGPGVDRSGDVLKHANYSGTSEHGGVLVVFGDDHPGKSSTISHQSEQALAANSIPSLYPANVEEIIEFGLLGIAMSRYTGLWIGLKTINETVEQTSIIDISVPDINEPEKKDLPAGGIHFSAREFIPQKDETRVYLHKLPLVHDFVKANNINKQMLRNDNARLGIVTSGKSYTDTMESLSLLDVNDERAKELGISLFKVGCIWPLEPSGFKDFASGVEELFFIEEKKAFLELQAATILYDEDSRPRLVGKTDELGKVLLPNDVQLEPIKLAIAIVNRLANLGIVCDALNKKKDELLEKLNRSLQLPCQQLVRSPLFCSGCPHNTSTNLPEGSVAGVGIGCHGMAYIHRTDMLPFTHMGAEGAQWAGMSPYVNTKHIFQNMGDGTFFHSGHLAIRSAIAAQVNITYKILFNDAVAMTGGQPIDGNISVASIAHQMIQEGATKCVIITDSPENYKNSKDLPSGMEVYHRDKLNEVQLELRETAGCTVIIYEQTCAAEKRRRRKRGLMKDPEKRLFIFDKVCEGCGDCSKQSNCISIEPKETVNGRKRQIDQSSCNKDYSCVKGFCPSFVSVYGGGLKKKTKSNNNDLDTSNLPPVSASKISNGSFNVVITGIGGTGVITVGAVLGMAAHIEGKECSIFDMTGLSQKGGAVSSHLRIAHSGEKIHSQRIGTGDADLVLGFDMIGSMAKDVLNTFSLKRTVFVGNTDIKPTAAFLKQPDTQFSSDPVIEELNKRVSEHNCHFFNATELALSIFGNTIATNLFVVGYAYQSGLLPLAEASILEAIKLNGVAIEFNIQAFMMGRLMANTPEKMTDLSSNKSVRHEETFDEMLERQKNTLTDYQNAAYSSRFLKLVKKVEKVESSLSKNDGLLTKSVAQSFYKIMAYKDEYEIARLYSSADFKRSLEEQFTGKYQIKVNMAPPLISKKDPVTGHLIKQEFSSWILKLFPLMKKMRFLRGSKLDVFGYSQERKDERELINSYERTIVEVCDLLTDVNYEEAIALAKLPLDIKGFGHVKAKNHKEFIINNKTQLSLFLNPKAKQEKIKVLWIEA